MSARSARPAFSPLDDQLALLPGTLTPQLHGWLVRLGAWMPFAQAAHLRAAFTQVSVSPSLARRQTEAAGATAVLLELQEVERIERDWPVVPPGPERVVLSVDGAMVPLQHREWGEVKTLAIGQVAPGCPLAAPPSEVHATELSYFSRLSDAESFGRLSLGELFRRRVETAGEIASVTDGADWIQAFVDYHCHDALRILDFAHAAERVSRIGQALFGEGTPQTRSWVEATLHHLKQHGVGPLLPVLRAARAAHPDLAELALDVAYLEKRVAQLQYATFQTHGWPIGSGMVESANKLVVEARLKGAGMHWARTQVNPMLALRNLICNGRWEVGWVQVSARRRPVLGQRRRERRARAAAVARAAYVARMAGLLTAPAPQRRKVAGDPARPRPAPNHPWRRYATSSAPPPAVTPIPPAKL